MVSPDIQSAAVSSTPAARSCAALLRITISMYYMYSTMQSSLVSTLAVMYVHTSFSVVRSIDSKNRFDSYNRSSKMCKVY